MFRVPYNGPLERTIIPGLIISINGRAPENAQRFHLNLQCGRSINPRDDVALHVAVDFRNQSVMTNSIIQQQWGPQEYSNKAFPFRPGVPFSINIYCTETRFEIYVPPNADPVACFEHRIYPSQITHIAIDGDIILENIKVEFTGGVQPTGAIGFKFPSTVTNFSSAPPYPTSPNPPYPAGAYSQPLPQAPYPSQLGYPRCPSPNPPVHPQQYGPYPAQPNYRPQQPTLYPQQPAMYPQQPGQQPYGGHSPNVQHKEKGLLDKMGLGGVASGGLLGSAAAGAAGLYGLKHLKKQKKLKKKALKLGLPIAGLGVGAYALHKAKFGFGSSSSSSSSSSSDSD